jgi:hypothetical protein
MDLFSLFPRRDVNIAVACFARSEPDKRSRYLSPVTTASGRGILHHLHRVD